MAFKSEVSRRAFLKTGGIVGGSAFLGGHLQSLAPAAFAGTPEKIEKELYGTCGVCSMGCAYIAGLRDGRIVRLKGNPNDQTAEGKLCVKGYSGINLLYDPDRLKYPMKRTNPEKGIGVDPKWVKISWDEALDLTAGKLKEVRDAHGPQAIAVIARPKPWTKHLAKAIGTPNLIVHINTCYSTHATMWRASVTGKDKVWTVDYENSRYILAFGWDAPGKSKNHWGRSVNTARVNGARLVVLDPRQSITAAKADEWIPIKPGTDLAFALAMINVIINENLYDKEYVETCTFGFDELKPAVQEYTPQWAASICGVPPDTIKRIAHEYATTKPSVVAHHKRDAGGPNYLNSWHLNRCYIILDALVGSLDRLGGHILDRKPKLPGLNKVFEMPPYNDTVKGPRVDGLKKFPLLAQTGKGSFSTLAEGILSGKPYPLKAAVVWKHNVLAFPNPKRLVEALKTLDFIAVSDVLPSEMVQLADVVLPDNLFFEGSGLNPRTYHAMYPQVALREKLPPVHQTKGFGGVVVELLRRMGLNEYAPEGMGGKAIMQAQLKALGTTAGEIRSNGGMWGEKKPFKGKTEFNTPSKKIELYSNVLKELGYDPLPKWVSPRAKVSKEFPFHYLIYRKPWSRMTQSQNDPVFEEFCCTGCPVIINQDTAKKLGINDGDEVFVESVAGKIKLNAKLIQGIRPDCVAIEHGFGHWSKGYSVACNKGGNDGDLIPSMTIEEQLEYNTPDMAAYMEDVVLKVYKA